MQMNQLPLSKKILITKLFAEGNSLRGTARTVDVSVTTVSKWLTDLGKACIKFHDIHVTNVIAQKIQADEMWSFVKKKEKNNDMDTEGEGSMWTFIAMDPDTKLVISWLNAKRNQESAIIFMKDLASRLSSSVQLTTDGYKSYIKAVHKAFDVPIDFAQAVKIYGDERSRDNESKEQHGRYKGFERDVIFGEPNPKFISTSLVERQNRTLRMGCKRFTRKTDAFSKKYINHCYAVAIHFVHYNFVRLHQTLNITPAMRAGLTKRFTTIEDMIRLVPELIAKKRGNYKKREKIGNSN